MCRAGEAGLGLTPLNNFYVLEDRDCPQLSVIGTAVMGGEIGYIGVVQIWRQFMDG